MVRPRLALLVAAVVLIGVSAAGVGLLRANDETPPAAPWDSYRTTSNGLEVFKLLRPCDDVSDIEVAESSSHVEVTLHVQSGERCTDLAVPTASRVELADAVGSRKVYDGECIDQGFANSLCLRLPREAVTHAGTRP